MTFSPSTSNAAEFDAGLDDVFTRSRCELALNFALMPSRPNRGEEEKINPGRWGAALARYLRQALVLQGFIMNEPFTEDWGYAIEIENPAFNLWIGCGNYEEYPDGFLCFIIPDKPFVWKRFRRIATTERIEAIADTLEGVLRKHPGVRDLRWWPDSQRNR